MKHSQIARQLTAFGGTGYQSPQRHYPSLEVRLLFPTADPVEITRAAHRLLPQIVEGCGTPEPGSCSRT